MEHPFFPTTTTRAEALRWLTISEKLLSVRDLMGSKSFATRARDSDPTLTPADQILAIVDTLLVGDSRIGNNQQDWYSILRLTPQQGRDSELIASQYGNLALILNPQRNNFPFAEQAFRLVVDAWSVLSDPSRKAIYDKELAFYLHPQQQQQPQPDPFHNPIPTLPQNFMFFGASGPSNVAQPQVHAGGSSSGASVHFPSQVQQVHTAQQQVDSVSVGSTREQQNFMNFASPSNIGFGSPSGSKSSQEPVYKQTQPSYRGFPAGNVAFASWSTQEPVNSNKQKEPVQDYPSVDDKTKNDAYPSENVEGASENVEDEVNEEEMDRVDVLEEGNEGDLSFWTTCPYCFYVYEYPREYADCTLRCQNCRRAFQAVVIPPPPTVDGQEGYFCCWGFLPLSVSMENWEKNRAAVSTWTPFSPMFTFPGTGTGRGRNNSGPRLYYDDDDVFVEMSEPSDSDDADWQDNNNVKKKKTSNVKGRGSSGTTNRSAKNVQVDFSEDGFVSPDRVEVLNSTGEPSKKGATTNARKQPGRVAKNLGKLDLNVEFSNETEEPAAAPRVNQGNGPGRGEDDNIEGIGFFEGLDEFLSSLPILNVVGDDKVVKAS